MGLAISKAFEDLTELLSFRTPTRVLMLGLDAAGKTSVLYKVKLNEIITTIPTVGFNVENVKYKNLDMTIWDVGGQDKIRALWRFYYENTDALIFLVDSNDRDRLQEAASELHKLAADDGLRSAVILVLANKQDLPQAMRTDEIAKHLALHSLKSHPWYIQPCSALTGDGVFEGLGWVHGALRNRRTARVGG